MFMLVVILVLVIVIVLVTLYVTVQYSYTGFYMDRKRETKNKMVGFERTGAPRGVLPHAPPAPEAAPTYRQVAESGSSPSGNLPQ